MTDTMQLRKQNSGGFGSSGSSQENLSNHMYNAANYNTIMVEYENGNREMAVVSTQHFCYTLATHFTPYNNC